jgi:MoaA/NifB/PqqE/SkfB family radical SAM enzyme
MPQYSHLQKVAIAVQPLARSLLPERIRAFLGNRLFSPPDGKRRMELLMDVVGSCNLRCPSCPVGNIGKINQTGKTDVSVFQDIIAKADDNYAIYRVSLYNWGEPLLHPQLPQLIKIVKDRNLYCALSSNLNVLRNEDAILAENPDELRISLSGFSQATYEKTHTRGDIERVKSNMTRLAEAKNKASRRNSTRIDVYYHKYRHNLDEIEPMKEFALSLGFNWMENWAYYMPLEKVLQFAEGTLSEAELTFVQAQIALPMSEALREARQFAHEPCRLWSEQIVLDYQGNAALCCSVFDLKANKLGFFLDMTPEDLMAAKADHPTCKKCTSHGIHRYGEYYDHPVLRPAYERLISSNIPESARVDV